jgi:hypothetical protein
MQQRDGESRRRGDRRSAQHLGRHVVAVCVDVGGRGGRRCRGGAGAAPSPITAAHRMPRCAQQPRASRSASLPGAPSATPGAAADDDGDPQCRRVAAQPRRRRRHVGLPRRALLGRGGGGARGLGRPAGGRGLRVPRSSEPSAGRRRREGDARHAAIRGGRRSQRFPRLRGAQDEEAEDARRPRRQAASGARRRALVSAGERGACLQGHVPPVPQAGPHGARLPSAAAGRGRGDGAEAE